MTCLKLSLGRGAGEGGEKKKETNLLARSLRAVLLCVKWALMVECKILLFFATARVIHFEE